MARRISMKDKRRDAPDWIFQWRPAGEPWFPKFLALALVVTVFAVLLSSVRIRTVVDSPWSSRKAAVIQVLDDAGGRALSLRAREGGPFPSRFEPSGWPELVALEKSALGIGKTTLPGYRPALRELSAGKRRMPALTEPGNAVLPKPLGSPRPGIPAAAARLVARIVPISGIHASAMPDTLPDFPGEVTPALAAAPTRFLVRLDPAGSVTDCVSLDAGDEAGPSDLERWMRGVSFKPGPAKASRWVALGVTFVNQPITADGAEPR
jgi:hypothetical protein